MAATEAHVSGPLRSSRTAEPVLESSSGRSGAPTRYCQAVATAATAAAVGATITSAYRSSCLGSGQCLASRWIAPLRRCEE